MTVITMPTTEKKSDNVPLVTNIEIDPSAQVSHCRRQNCGLCFFFASYFPVLANSDSQIISSMVFYPLPPPVSIGFYCDFVFYYYLPLPALCYFPVSSTSRSSDVLFFLNIISKSRILKCLQYRIITIRDNNIFVLTLERSRSCAQQQKQQQRAHGDCDFTMYVSRTPTCLGDSIALLYLVTRL